MELDSDLLDLATALKQGGVDGENSRVGPMPLGCILLCHADVLAGIEQARGIGEGEEVSREGGQVGCLPLQQVSTLVGEDEGPRGERVENSSAKVQGWRRHQVRRGGGNNHLNLVDSVIAVEVEDASELCLAFKSSDTDHGLSSCSYHSCCRLHLNIIVELSKSLKRF